MVQSVMATFEQLGRAFFFQVAFYQLPFQWDKLLKEQLFQVLAM